MKTTTFTLKFINDESNREKLKVMDPLDVMFDDERNVIPEKYWEIVEGLKFGDSIEIAISAWKEKEND